MNQIKINKTIVLFDMDGTLTEPRQKFVSKNLINLLYQITNLSAHVGIITGSDEDYLKEQMGDFLQNSSSRYRLHLLPCNGTKYFQPPKFANHDFKMTHEVSMEEHLGKENYYKLIHELILSQVHMATFGIPLTGHFINCRGSMINWSPIGRNAGSDERDIFKTLDKNSVDLILTDPPYEISRPSGYISSLTKPDGTPQSERTIRRFAVDLDFGDWDKQNMDLLQYRQILKLYHYILLTCLQMPK